MVQCVRLQGLYLQNIEKRKWNITWKTMFSFVHNHGKIRIVVVFVTVELASGEGETRGLVI